MTDLSDSSKLVYKARHKIRFVSAASLFHVAWALAEQARRCRAGKPA